MPDLTPITREEKILAGEDIDVITRREWFLKKYRSGGDITIEPITITENGTTTAPIGKAYSPIYTNVGLPENAYLLKDFENVPSDIVTFNDGTALPMPSLKTTIVPIQSGSGDPSPSNVRPISGWSGANVSVCGKNLFDKSTLIANKAYTNNYEYLPVTGISTVFVPVIVGTTITISGMKNWGVAYINCFVDGYQGNYISTVGSRTSSGGIANPVTVTVPNNAVYLAMAVYTGSSDYEQFQDKDTIQVEVGNQATTYEPYNPNSHTYTIPFTDAQGNPIEVYGGECDVVNGVLKVNYKIVNAKNLVWTYFSSTNACYAPCLDADATITSEYPTGKRPIYCNIAEDNETSAMQENQVQWGGATNNKNLNIKNIYTTSLADWQNYIAENDVMIAYAIEPIIIQLNPTSIKSLEGTNNVWGDCGQISEGSYFAKSEEE